MQTHIFDAMSSPPQTLWRRPMTAFIMGDEMWQWRPMSAWDYGGEKIVLASPIECPIGPWGPWGPMAPWAHGVPWAHRACNRARKTNLFASVVIAIASNKDFSDTAILTFIQNYLNTLITWPGHLSTEGSTSVRTNSRWLFDSGNVLPPSE